MEKENLCNALTETHVFWHDLYVIPRSLSRVLMDSTQEVKVNCTLVSKDLYVTGRQTIERLAKSTATQAATSNWPQYSYYTVY
jgi:hypothetical protein